MINWKCHNRWLIRKYSKWKDKLSSLLTALVTHIYESSVMIGWLPSRVWYTFWSFDRLNKDRTYISQLKIRNYLLDSVSHYFWDNTRMNIWFLSFDCLSWAITVIFWSFATEMVRTTTAISRNCIWFVIQTSCAKTTFLVTFFPAVIV